MSQAAAFLPDLLAQPWAWALGWTLIHSLAQGLVVAALVAAGLALLRGASPQMRYALACGGLVVMLVLPTATWWSLYRAASPSPSARVAVLPAPVFVGAGPPSAAAPAISSMIDDRSAIGGASSTWGIERTVPVIVTGWLVGVAVLALWRTGGLVYAVYLCRRGTRPSAPVWQERLMRLRDRLRVGRPVALMESPQVRAPVVIGWLRPVILVPVGMFTGLSVPQLDAILAHELVHVRRWDYLVNLLQTTAENLLFYHPAVWWISHRIRVEREYCCDDAAAACSGSAQAYAGALAALETWVGARPLLGMAVGGGSLLDRVQRQLVAGSSRDTGGWGPLLALPVLVLAVGLLGLPDRGHGAARDRGEIVRYPFDGPGVVTGPALRVHGVAPAQDRFGTPDAAYRFDGGKAVVEMEEAVRGDFRTIVFWARSEVPITADSPRGYMVMGSCLAGVPDDVSGVIIGSHTGGLDNEVLTLLWEGGYKAFYWTTATLPQGIDAAWHHYAFIWDEPAGSYGLHLDGMALGTADMVLWNNCTTEAPTTSPVPTFLADRRWQFGRAENLVDHGWLGVVDGVRIWDRPLSGVEVEALYRATDTGEAGPGDTRAARESAATMEITEDNAEDIAGYTATSKPSVLTAIDGPDGPTAVADSVANEEMILLNSSPRSMHYDLTTTGAGFTIEPRQCDLASRQRQVLRLTGPEAGDGVRRVYLTAELARGPFASGVSLMDTVETYSGTVAYTAFRSLGVKYTLLTAERDTPQAAAVRAYVRETAVAGEGRGQARERVVD